VAEVSERDLLPLIQLYLLTHQDSLVRAAITRRLALDSARSAFERGWTLLRIIHYCLSAAPVRIDLARHYVAQLDAMGVPVSYWRLSAHLSLSHYAMMSNDLSGAITEANAARSAGATMTREDRIDQLNALVETYAALAEPVSLRVGGLPVIAILDTAIQELLPLRAPGTRGARRRIRAVTPLPSASAMDTANGIPTAAVPPLVVPKGEEENAQARLKSMISKMQKRYAAMGTTAPPIRASHWYPLASDSGPYPTPGAVTLFVYLDIGCSNDCHTTYAMVRRLYDKYHEAGLHVMFATQTGSRFRGQLILDPVVYSEKLRGYFLDFLKLPGVLGIDETVVGHRTDGRRINTPGTSARDYFSLGNNGVIIGKDGKIRALVGVYLGREAVIDAIIAKELGK
jgi:hypothetical protein